MKERHFYYNKKWFVFPFAFVLDFDCYEFYPPAKRIEFHFLWWHWKWTFHNKKE